MEYAGSIPVVGTTVLALGAVILYTEGAQSSILWGTTTRYTLSGLIHRTNSGRIMLGQVYERITYSPQV